MSTSKHIIPVLVLATVLVAVVLLRSSDRSAEPTNQMDAPAEVKDTSRPGEITIESEDVSPPVSKPRVDEGNSQHRERFLDSTGDETIRNNAAIQLIREHDGRIVADLTRMLQDEQETVKWRTYCVQLLRLCYERHPDPETLATIMTAAENPIPKIRACAIWSLARLASEEDSGSVLSEAHSSQTRAMTLKALREKDAHFLITEAGVQSCARLGLTESLPEIRDLAGSADTKPTHLRVVAVAALGELKDDESVPLLERLSKEAARQLQSAAELAIKRIKEASEKKEAEQAAPAPEARF